METAPRRAPPRPLPSVDETVAELATRGFVSRPGRGIAVATVAGLLAMGLSFAVSTSPLVSMAALFAGILLALGLQAGDMRYRLTATGLHRSFLPLAGFGSRGRREQFFPFAAMRFYRRDRDLSRYRQEEVESLTIGLSRPPFRIVIHDLIDKTAFGSFADAFEALAARPDIALPRRPGFYATIWAKLLLVVFAAAAGFLIALMASGTLSATNTFRLMVVILPGVAYMGWRILGRRARPAEGRQASQAGGG